MSELALTPEEHNIVMSSVERLTRKYSGVFGRETIERFVMESLEGLQSDRIRTFIPLFAERFTGDRLEALAKVEGRSDTGEPTVLFLCVKNAGRSQMAMGWMTHLADGRIKVYSGGSEPGDEVHAVAIDAMAERGIDIRSEFPKPWTDEIVRAADVVVTMGCGDACPVFPGKRYLDWELEDPHGRDLEVVRGVRDDIELRVRRLMHELGVVPIDEEEPASA